MTELEPRLSDDEAQKVLARALELQAQGAGALSLTQVREIAAEMSIPESAVDQAMAEFRAAASKPQAERVPTPSFWKRVRTTHPILLGMALLGAALLFFIASMMVFRV